jgi:hypothetical protein
MTERLNIGALCSPLAVEEKTVRRLSLLLATNSPSSSGPRSHPMSNSLPQRRGGQQDRVPADLAHVRLLLTSRSSNFLNV